jgi:transaldolase
MTTLTTPRLTKMKQLLDLGQSVWLDYLHRHLTRSGDLAALIDDGLRGMTSNPTIFERAIAGSGDYDDDLADAGSSSRTDREVFETLAITDVREAADLFRPVYDATAGADGFVSLEVSPGVARDTGGSIDEARRLWQAVNRPNVMIKIPGTREGWPAIERCLQDAININVTLLFSEYHYRAVAEAYCRALEARVKRGEPIDRVASVASFFVSRIDSEVDKRIQARGGALLPHQGKAALAGARLAYEAFTEMTRTPRWQALEAKGAKRQRLLWASTGTKNPRYSDVMYVESLVGPDTITTVPPDTLSRFEDHGRISNALAARSAEDAHGVMDVLAAGGIDFADVNRTLEDEGIEKFAASFVTLLDAVARKRRGKGNLQWRTSMSEAPSTTPTR